MGSSENQGDLDQSHEDKKSSADNEVMFDSMSDELFEEGIIEGILSSMAWNG